jgi:hypothetical protein
MHLSTADRRYYLHLLTQQIERENRQMREAAQQPR